MSTHGIADVRYYTWGTMLRECGRPRDETTEVWRRVSQGFSSASAGYGDSWDLGLDYDATLALARGLTAWPQGRDEIETRAREQATQNLRKLPVLDYGWDVEGQFFDVPAVVEGRPEQWMQPQWGMVGERAAVRIVMDASASAACSATAMCDRMYSIAAAALTIERAGIACEVFVITTAVDKGPRFSLSIQLNNAGEPLDITRLIAVAHPAFFRRIMFRMIEMTPAEEVAKAYYGTYGHVAPLPPDTVTQLYGPHAYFVPGLNSRIGVGPTIAALNDILTARDLGVFRAA